MGALCSAPAPARVSLFTSSPIILYKMVSSNPAELNQYLADRSYIDGYEASSADATVFAEVKTAPDAKQYPHASRWFNHISSFTEEERKAFRAGKVPAATSTATTPAKKDDDDIDLFGDDDENDEE